MTAATIVDILEVNDPNKEVVVLTVTDLNTYVSKKFAAVTGVQATLMEDAGSLTYPLSCDVSGGTVEINCEGLSSKKVCLTLWGRK